MYIDGRPILNCLQCIDASLERLSARIRAAEGKAATLTAEAHSAMMRQIESARRNYQLELIALSYAVRLTLAEPAVN